MADYRRFIRQWALVLGRFLALHPRLVVPLTRAGLDAWRCARARRAGEVAREILVAPGHREGRLTARPGGVGGQAPRGLRRLNLAGGCDALLYVPAGYRPGRPARVALMLHGATSVGLAALYLILPFADAANLIVLAPDAPRRTWDRTRGGFGPDVAFVDRALTTVFAHYAIDPNHIAIGGFSDGASYALSLGLTNGNLFTHVIAFSPGFFAPAAPIGRPRVFVSHGTRDEILPISGSRRIVEVLRGSGYDVTSVEFDGPHIVPFDIAHQAMDWFQRKEA